MAEPPPPPDHPPSDQTTGQTIGPSAGKPAGTTDGTSGGETGTPPSAPPRGRAGDAGAPAGSPPGSPEGPRSPGPRVDASLYLHPQTLARLDTMELRAKHIVEGVMSGTHRSPYKGVSVDFAQHRPYVAGDDLRHLDWKVYARTDKLHLKQYEQETNLDLILLVDCSGSMNYGSRSFAGASGTGVSTSPDGRTNWTKYDHATALAAALSYITIHQGDRVGMAVFADEIRALVARSNKRAAWRQVVEALATEPVDAPTDLVRVTDQVLGKIRNRTLFALISDFFADPEDIRRTMARVRHRGHDLIAFQILDRAETEFDFDDHAPFVGLEGEAPLRVNPRALRSAYLDALAEHNTVLEKHVHAFGFELHRVGTHDWLGPPLAAFLARRTARLGSKRVGS